MLDSQSRYSSLGNRQMGWRNIAAPATMGVLSSSWSITVSKFVKNNLVKACQ